MDEEFDLESEYDGPSRSELKRQKQRIQDLMMQALSLSKADRRTLAVDELFSSELEVAVAMKPSSARNRMVRRLANLGEANPEIITSIQQVVDSVAAAKTASNAMHHGAERWRTRLLNEDNKALTEFFGEYPNAEIQRLRQMLREHAKTQNVQRKTRLFRELYQIVFAAIKDAESYKSSAERGLTSGASISPLTE